MIRAFDGFVLAYTKLRSHKVRTGLTVGVAGILFGLIIAVIIVAQGVFDSVDRFSEEGLGSRYLLAVSRYGPQGVNPWEHAEDDKFVAAIEREHKAMVEHKTAVAKKYNVPYSPEAEDPSPIGIDPDTKQKIVRDEAVGTELVQRVADELYGSPEPPKTVKDDIAPYQTATILEGNNPVQSTDGEIVYMREGKERSLDSKAERFMNTMGVEDPNLMVMNETLTTPFMVKHSFDPASGEIPVIVTFDRAEKLLGLKTLDKDATTEDKLARLSEVRQRVGEVTASYCYRNRASAQLLSTATQQQEEIRHNKDNKDYQMPSLLYATPDESSCGAVTVTKDVRTAAEKRAEENYIAYQKELGIWLGEPVQHKITVRGVGVYSSMMAESGVSGTVGQMASMLLGSSLGYGDWVAPRDLLRQVPEEYRPSELFQLEESDSTTHIARNLYSELRIVEFTDKEEARDMLKLSGMFGGAWNENGPSVSPFGSSTLVVDEMRGIFTTVLLWALGIVGGIALIILASLIGRTVADGRRESAVFRAIGASRLDIGSIYGSYALLLSLRAALFALVLGAVLALVVELIGWQDATLGARLSYAAMDTTKEFHLFGVGSWYIPAVLGAIIVVGLVASIIPILLGARRNPINDMRSE